MLTPTRMTACAYDVVLSVGKESLYFFKYAYNDSHSLAFPLRGRCQHS